MTYSFVFDIPKNQRYAIPFSIISKHKIDTLIAEGKDWKSLPATEWTDEALIDWMMQKMKMDEIRGYMRALSIVESTNLTDILPIGAMEING